MTVEEYLSSEDIEIVELGLIIMAQKIHDVKKRLIVANHLVKLPMVVTIDKNGELHVSKYYIWDYPAKDIFVKDPTRILKLKQCTKK